MIENNRVFGNSTGINVNGNTLVRGNQVWDTQSGAGISQGNGIVENNQVWGGASTTGAGIDVSGGVARNNRVWGNTAAGINVSSSGSAAGNRVYGNSGAGIVLTYYTTSAVGNLVYDNAGAGILINGGNGTARNNTVMGNLSDAIVVQSSASAVVLLNNILQVSSGRYGIRVAPDSEVGFSSDYNLFQLDGTAQVGFWENRALATRADWSYELGQDMHSLTAAAGFVNPLGADGHMGWEGETIAGGVQIIDDGDAGFSTTGTWSTLSGAGRGNDYRASTAGDATAQASWSFSGLAPGYYRVAASWPLSYTSTGVARYTLYDGGVLTGRIDESQYGSTSDDFTDAGTGWERLGLVYVSGGTLDVEVRNTTTTGQLLADAVRLERVERRLRRGRRLPPAGGLAGVDRGSRRATSARAVAQRCAHRPGRLRQHRPIDRQRRGAGAGAHRPTGWRSCRRGRWCRSSGAAPGCCPTTTCC